MLGTIVWLFGTLASLSYALFLFGILILVFLVLKILKMLGIKGKDFCSIIYDTYKYIS